MQVARFKKPFCKLPCHHIIRYNGKQSLFIENILLLKDDNNSDLAIFFGCRLCLDCAYKIFLNSNRLKVFESLCLRPDVSILHILTQILCKPQIYHYIARNKKAFTLFFKITMASMYSLMNCSTKGDMLIIWETILSVLLSLCVKPYHLKWIMRLKQVKYNDEFGNNLWNSFVMIPFNTFVKQIFTFTRNSLDPRAVYGNWICLQILICDKQSKLLINKKTQDVVQQCIREIKHLNYTNINNDLLMDSEVRLHEKTYMKYALYYDNTKCQNKTCGKQYLKHKFGVNKLAIARNAAAQNPLKVIEKFYVCKGCKLVFYCSRKCQKIDWKIYNHKQFCLCVQRKLS